MEKKVVDALKWMVEILGKKNIEYQIAGGFAAKVFGSSRPLNDIDFDISENFFPKILSDVSQYITYGPARLNDGKWDCELITLNYHGQEIDISGVDSMKLSNKERNKWIPYKENFFKNVELDVDGMKLRVIHPRELVAYKQELDGEQQLTDIRATEQYLARNRL